MLLKHTFNTALHGLYRNKSRSALTILGIVIGITAIMLIMSLGKGAQGLILGQIQGLGSKTIVVLPGREPKGPMSAMGSLMSDSLKNRDVEALGNESNVPTLASVTPIVFGSASAAYEGETYRLTILGVSELIMKLYDMEIEQGAFFNDDDIKARASVVVIGSKVKDELFGQSSAVGKKIRIKDRNLRVVGVIRQKGSGSLVNFDEAVFAPYTTVQQYILGVKYYHRLVLEADSELNVDQTVSDVKATLRDLHNITDPEKDDFYVETQAGLMDMVSTIMGVLTLFLVAVAAISLIVGGVGIMNIMLVSVTERTREIGLRKALGATERDILAQFLLEAVALTGTGGLIGIILGASFSLISSLVLSKALAVNWEFTFPFSAMLLGLGVSAFVGFVFGLYPARQAAQKSPMEALRYE